MTSDKQTLQPCPFCGGEAWLNDYEAKYSDLPPKSRCPQCRSCGASLGYLTTPEKATAAWNRRATASPSLGERERVARIIACMTYTSGDKCDPDAVWPRLSKQSQERAYETYDALLSRPEGHQDGRGGG